MGLVPLLLVFGSLELGLRLAGYGFPTGFFKTIRIGSEDCLVENDRFGLRFFPSGLARSPAPVVMKAVKPAETCRVFMLGESAALGDPRPAYGPGRYLQVLLEERFPDVRFEVICVAMTAINSHAILPIAQECARHQGDLWIIYMGNNEMVGPFGAATVFGAQAPSLRLVRLNLALQRTRVGQLLAALARNLARRSRPAQSWGGMEMFMQSRVPPDDPRKQRVYHNFQANLEDILQAGLGSGSKIILNTVAVNLKDCPPFASLRADSLSVADRAASERLVLAATEADAHGDFSRAAQGFSQAAVRDPQDAALRFRLGASLLRLTNGAAAREEFELARDLDTLPFRADAQINRAIIRLGRHYAGADLALLETEALFATNSPSGIAGDEAFYEHVHFNFDGNYRLGRAWAELAERFLPTSATNRAAPEWASQAICERRLGLTDWNRAAVLEDMLRRLAQPPFSSQSGQEQRLETYRSRLREVRLRTAAAAAPAARELYQEALQRSPTDYRLHENFAEFLEAIGDLPQAVAEWQRVRELLPHHHLGYFQAGRLLARQDKLAEARSLLSQAVALRPDLSPGWLELGKLSVREGQWEAAVEDYERARKLLPENPEVYFQIGRALSKLNRRRAAIAQFRVACQVRTNYWEARYALGEELAFNGEVAAARTEFEEVIRLRPEYPMAHLNLGVALTQEGQLPGAIKQFEETLRLEPQNKLARDYLEKIRSRPGDKR